MSNPEYARVNNKLYKINTDFQVALECEKVVRSNVSKQEQSLAVLYLLFGDEGLNNPKDWQELMNVGCKYLLCNKEPEEDDGSKTIDYEQDKSYIKASFFTDYGIPNIYNEHMHWWDFCDYMNGLTENCVLNRVRYVREYDISKLEGKELQEWKKRKKAVELKHEEKEATEEQQKASDEFYKSIGM